MSESHTVDLSLFYFYFYLFSILKKQGLGFSIMLHVTVTNGHMTRLSVTH